MDSEREKIKQELLENFRKKVDEMLDTPTVTMTDIENVVSQLLRAMGQEAAESLIRLIKLRGRTVESFMS